MDIFIIKTGLEYAIRNVQDLTRGKLKFEQKNAVAVASVGNTLIGLWAKTEKTTQMEIEVFRPVKVGEYFKWQRDDAARVLCDALIRDLRESKDENGKELLTFYNKARSAEETLRVIRLNENTNKAELAKLSKRTAKDATTEYLARRFADPPTEPATMQTQDATPGKALPPVKDSIDQQILDLVKKDPDLKDQAIGQKIGISRQAVNTRRGKLKAMGYPVR